MILAFLMTFLHDASFEEAPSTLSPKRRAFIVSATLPAGQTDTGSHRGNLAISP